MASFFSFLSSLTNSPENETNKKKRISENKMLGEGSYKKVFDIKEEEQEKAIN